jgi:hypothetical protein
MPTMSAWFEQSREKENVEDSDFGKLGVNSVGTDVGLSTNSGRDAMIPEEGVTTRKPV